MKCLSSTRICRYFDGIYGQIVLHHRKMLTEVIWIQIWFFLHKKFIKNTKMFLRILRSRNKLKIKFFTMKS